MLQGRVMQLSTTMEREFYEIPEYEIIKKIKLLIKTVYLLKWNMGILTN